MQRLISLYRLLTRAAAPEQGLIRRFIRRALAGFAPQNCLDLGAGSAPCEATVRACAPGVRYWKSDLPPAHDQHWACDAVALPLRDHSLDLVLLLETLPHMSDPERALDEVRRVLRPGGRLVISYRFLYGECAVHDFRRWTMEGMTDLLTRRGFRILDHRRQGGAAFALVMLIGGWIDHLIPGGRRSWRSRRDGRDVLRLGLLTLLRLPLDALGFLALALDRPFASSPAVIYSGAMVLAERIDDDAPPREPNHAP